MTQRLSLKARLVVAIGLITLVSFALADLVVLSALRSYLYNQVDQSLEASHRVVEQTADNPYSGTSGGFVFVPPGPPPSHGLGPSHLGPAAGAGKGNAGATNPGSSGGSAFCAIGRESAPGTFIEVLNSSGEVVTGAAGREECPAFQAGNAWYSPKLPATITGFRLTSQDPAEPTVYFTTSSTEASGPALRVRASELANGDLLILALPVSNVTNTLSQLVLLEVLVTAGALVAAAAASFWLVRVGLRPLRDMEKTADAISAGNLMQRVPNVNPRTEVGHVAGAFNVMLGRISGLVDDLRGSQTRLRRFVGDASHELRTPIAAISAYAQLFRQGAASRPEDLQRAMSGIERESLRMAQLVEDLLTLARLDEGPQLQTEPVELVGLAMEACETAEVVGPQWPVRLVADDAVEVEGDRGALRQVLDNLLANVRAHTPEGTIATVTVGQSGQEAFMEVADNGPGVTEQQAGVIFERFFRLDPSRSRETGGAGLGLAIVASIIAAHGGRVLASPKTGGGAVFKVVLPRLAPGLVPEGAAYEAAF